MLDDNGAMTQAELEQQAEDLIRRARQLKRDIKALSQRAGAPQTYEESLLMSVTSWLESCSSRQEWTDITELYSQYSAWVSKHERPDMGMKMFGKFIRKTPRVGERKHPTTRRTQLWLP